MLSPLLRLAPAPRICSLPSFDWPLPREYARFPPSSAPPFWQNRLVPLEDPRSLQQSILCRSQQGIFTRGGPIAERNGAYSPGGDQSQKGTGNIHQGGGQSQKETGHIHQGGPIAEGNGAYSPGGDQSQKGTGHIHQGGTHRRRERGIFGAYSLKRAPMAAAGVGRGVGQATAAGGAAALLLLHLAQPAHGTPTTQ
eukprot:1185537-Prorocentrum_minimum.AAC.6